jgi:hypothetical protein
VESQIELRSATSAKEHAKTFASSSRHGEAQSTGTLAGALVVGVVIGLISRDAVDVRCVEGCSPLI